MINVVSKPVACLPPFNLFASDNCMYDATLSDKYAAHDFVPVVHGTQVERTLQGKKGEVERDEMARTMIWQGRIEVTLLDLNVEMLWFCDEAGQEMRSI